MRNLELPLGNPLAQHPLAQQWMWRLLLVAVVASSALGLWPDLAASRLDLNDNVSHFAMVERMVQAIQHGENPLDCWSPEWSFGYPMLRVYQTLPHALVAVAYFLLGKTVSLMTVFVWVRFLAVVLLPLSFYRAALWLELGPAAALAAAIAAPLVSISTHYLKILWTFDCILRYKLATDLEHLWSLFPGPRLPRPSSLHLRVPHFQAISHSPAISSMTTTSNCSRSACRPALP